MTCFPAYQRCWWHPLPCLIRIFHRCHGICRFYRFCSLTLCLGAFYVFYAFYTVTVFSTLSVTFTLLSFSVSAYEILIISCHIDVKVSCVSDGQGIFFTVIRDPFRRVISLSRPCVRRQFHCIISFALLFCTYAVDRSDEQCSRHHKCQCRFTFVLLIGFLLNFYYIKLHNIM